MDSNHNSSHGSSSSNYLNYYKKLSKVLAEKQNKVNLRKISGGCIVPRNARTKIVTKEDVIARTLFAKYGKNTQTQLNRNSQEKNKPPAKEMNPFNFKEPEPKKLKRKFQESYINMPSDFFHSFMPNFSLFKRRKQSEPKQTDPDPPPAVNPRNSTSGNNTTVGSISIFDPKTTSTPLNLNPFVSDPEEVLSDIANDKETERKNNENYYCKLMDFVDKVAGNIDEFSFGQINDPIENDILTVKKMCQLPRENDNPEKLQIMDSVKSNNFWDENNKTVIEISQVASVQMENNKTYPNEAVIRGNPSSSIFKKPLSNSMAIPIMQDDQQSLFDDTFEGLLTEQNIFLNESQPTQFDFAIESPALVDKICDVDFKFMTPPGSKFPDISQNTQLTKWTAFDSPGRIFNDFDEDHINKCLEEINLSQADDDDSVSGYSFAEFQSPPVARKLGTSQNARRIRESQMNSTQMSSFRWNPYISSDFANFNPNGTLSSFGSPDSIFGERDIFTSSFF